MLAATLDGEIKKYLVLVDNGETQSTLQYNQEIDEAMARIDKGEFITHEEVEKEMESW